MVEQKPHLDPDMGLQTLAGMLDLPAHQLSQLLKEGFGGNFADYVNRYRLEVFKTKVADPVLRQLLEKLIDLFRQAN